MISGLILRGETHYSGKIHLVRVVGFGLSVARHRDTLHVDLFSYYSVKYCRNVFPHRKWVLILAGNWSTTANSLKVGA